MRKKRILAVLLSSAIAFSGMPGNVFAAEDVALEDGFSDGETADVTENPTEDVTEEPVKDVGESVLESDQGAEDFTGFSDGENEDFVNEEEIENETDPETQVFADDEGVAESGKCGDDLTYTLTGDDINGYTLTISGTGKMEDYSWRKEYGPLVPWKSKCSKIINVDMSVGVTTIGDFAFNGCSRLNNITIPNGITSIGSNAFDACENLENIILPESVTSVGESAFISCSKLSSIVLPEGVTNIKDATFTGCVSLTDIKIPKSVTSISSFAFFVTGLKTVRYAGTKEDWDKLNVLATDINNAKVYYDVDTVHEHSGESKVVKHATCTEPGKKITVCSLCGESYTEEIPATGHTIVIDPAVEVTCEEAGKTEGSHCSVCGEVIVPQSIIPATGKHSWDGGKVTKTATCVENGITTYTCAKCGTTRTEEIKALGHTIVIDPAVEVTCEEAGKTEGSHCSVCGEVIKAQEVISATGHSWGEWKVIDESTSSKEVVRQRVCKVCGMHDDEMIPKLSPAPTPTVDPINPSTVIITKGKTTTLKLDSSWKNVKYSTSNKKVATVDKKGKVKAVAAGIAKITVKSGSESIVYTITVPGTTAIKGIKSSVSIKKGKRYTLKPKLSYTEKADKVTYKSSNKKIATVSKKGVIKGKKKGTATITIKSGKITKKCKVKVK